MSSFSWSCVVCWVSVAIVYGQDSNCSQPSSDVGVSLLALNKGHLARARQTQQTLALAPQSHQASVSTNSEGEQYLNKATSAPWMARSIKDIFHSTGTDKLWKHGYHRYYEEKLSPFREQPGMRVLEIGADSGISLGAWLTYFKDPAEVAGVAYNVDAKAAHDKSCQIMPDQCQRLKIVSMDQSDKAALNNLKQEEPEGWDIVIDDGSHKPEHQIISFQFLWEKIRPGGMYVIEDIETSYVDNGKEVYGYALNGGIGVPPPKNAVEKFKELVDVVSRKHFNQEQFTVFGGVDKDVAEVDFGDGIIFVHKKPSDPEWSKYPTQPVFVKKTDSDNVFQKYQAKVNSEAATTEKVDEKGAADQAAAVVSDKTASDKVSVDNELTAKELADKATAAKAAADKAAFDKVAADKALADKLAADKVTADSDLIEAAAPDKNHPGVK